MKGQPSRADKPAQTTLKYEVEVGEDGQVALTVTFTPGTRLVVFVMGEQAESFDDLVRAAESSLDFWDNPFDDQDWNDA
jgi:hypothetical protein